MAPSAGRHERLGPVAFPKKKCRHEKKIPPPGLASVPSLCVAVHIDFWPTGHRDRLAKSDYGARYTPSFLRLFLQIFFYFFVLEFFLAPHESVSASGLPGDAVGGVRELNRDHIRARFQANFFDRLCVQHQCTYGRSCVAKTPLLELPRLPLISFPLSSHLYSGT